MRTSGSVIVSWDFSHGQDVGVLIVGEQKKGKVEIVNAFQGEEAEELYKKLTVSKKTQLTSFVRGKKRDLALYEESSTKGGIE